jgi:hAT family dimerisation domain.
MNNDEILQPIQQKLEQAQSVSLVRPKTSTFLQKLKSTRNEQEVDDEVNKYWSSNDAAEDVKPLDWWRTHSTEYPNLSKLAADYLCIQASSVPCEQLFSVAGQILCKSRNRLTGESVRACICLRSWILENIN